MPDEFSNDFGSGYEIFIFWIAVLRILDPVLFLTPGSGIGMGKKSISGSGLIIPDHISESLELFYVVLKTLKFFVADQVSGSGNFLTLDPVSGIENF
jgi:hypothetical protein